MPETYHVPVMLAECLDGLNIQPEGTYVDLTFGGGGHSRAILERLTTGKLYAFDQDPDAKANADEFKNDDRFQFIESNFRYFRRYLKMYGVTKVNGILADLGVSSHQIDDASRGFSTRFDSGLDMRMSQDGDLDAKTVLNTYSAEDLQSVFSKYGEIRNAKTLAQEIVKARDAGGVNTVRDLNTICESLVFGNKINKYLAQVYQALRIEVNQELEALKEMLLECTESLYTDGRIVVMSYHSLEDRLVKNLFATGNTEGDVHKDFYGNLLRPLKPLSNKVIQATEDEKMKNPRSRSAKLRIGIKLENDG